VRAFTNHGPHSMKLYDNPMAPNPRRVRVFLAEKQIDVERVLVDMRKGEHKTPEFLRKNANGQIPVLELDDGTCISESVAICRYFEALQPAPSLFGTSPVEIGLIDMHHRRIELQLGHSISTSWVNGPVVASIAAGRFVQIPQAKEQADERVNAYYQRLDKELADRAMMAGDTYSVVDITAMCLIDFAEKLVGLPPDPALTNLARWRAEVGTRSSASA
jgi:glutathione S-transferase